MISYIWYMFILCYIYYEIYGRVVLSWSPCLPLTKAAFILFCFISIWFFCLFWIVTQSIITHTFTQVNKIGFIFNNFILVLYITISMLRLFSTQTFSMSWSVAFSLGMSDTWSSRNVALWAFYKKFRKFAELVWSIKQRWNLKKRGK